MQQAWNYYDNGFRLLRLTSMLGIWCGVLLLLLADADAALSQSAGKKNGGIPALLQPRRSAGNKRTSDAPEQMLWTDFDYFDDASSNGDPTDFFEDRIHFGEPLLNHPEAYMNSPEIIRNRGYPVEIHHVTTEDGYVLELHRIPPRHNGVPPASNWTGGNIHGYSDLRGTVGRGRPVFLQHGVFSSSVCWLINPSHRSLAFRLADLGYDVWLGNTRGNIYSRSHIYLDPDDAEFWQYSWDEIGYYDIPACIHYVLGNTGWDKLVYAGHSLGTGLFFIAMIRHPELNSKVHRMIALAPISSKHNLRSPFRLISPIIQPLAYLLDKLRVAGAIFDETATIRVLQRKVCERNFVKASFCRDILFTIAGANPDSFDLSLLPSVNAHLFQGTSIRVIAQFAQHYNSGREVFQQYDYGKKGNLERYGTVNPSIYDLSKVTAPVYLYYGLNDLISTPEDSEWAAGQLGNVQGFFQIDDELFNHWDFLWSTNVNELLYDHILPLFS